MAESPTQAILFDIDGTLIESGGSSDRAWHRAFEELHGVDVEISKVTGKGVPDPAVGRQAFEAVIGREPSDEEMAKLMAKRLEYLPEEVESSEGYTVMPSVEELLEQLIDDGVLLGLVTGNVEAAAHIKLARANLNRFFSFGGYGSDSDDRGELTKKSLERGGDGLRRTPRPRALLLGRRHPARRRRRPLRRHPRHRGRHRQVLGRAADRGGRRRGDRVLRGRPAAARALIVRFGCQTRPR